MRFLILATLLLSGPVACGGGACTADARAGLSVSVVDSGTLARVCTATVTVTDGSYSETLGMSVPPPEDGGPPCFYYGAFERAGTYAVDARAEGRESRVTGIVVTKDDCHVVPREITLKL